MYRVFLLSVFLLALCNDGFSQKISYDLPKDYKKVISAEAYRQLVDLSIPIIAKRYAIEEVQQGEVRLKAGQEMQLLNLHNLIL